MIVGSLPGEHSNDSGLPLANLRLIGLCFHYASPRNKEAAFLAAGDLSDR